MMNKVINHVVLATIDSLTKFKNKLAYYLAIFAMGVGSTFGTFNAANADAVAITNSQDVVFGDLNEADDTVTFADNATAATLAISAGDITVDTVGNLGAGNMTVTMIDSGSAGFLQIDGDVTVSGGHLTFTAIDKATTFRLAGNVTASNSKNPIFLLNATDIIEYTGTTKNIDGTVLGVANNEGTMTLAGVTEFDGIIGASESLKAINVSATKSGDFNAAVDAGIITNLGTIIVEGALGVNTLTNSGTASLNAATTNVAAGDEAAVVMHTTGSILNFTGASASAQDVIITATTDGFGTINVFDATDDAAGGTTTLAAAALVGVSGTAVGTLNVGKSDGTKAGNLTTVDAGAMFVDNVNITGGNHVDEDSTLNLLEAITTEAITLSATGGADATFQTSGTTVAVTGTVDSASGTDGAGFTIINADIATQFASNIGATVAIEKMDIAAIKVDVDGVTNAIEAVHFSADGTLEFDAAAAQTLTGAITAVNENGLITNANTSGVLTISGAVGTEAARIKEISLLDNSDTTFTNAVHALTLDLDTAAADDVTTFTTTNIIGDDGTVGGALQIAGGTIVLDTAVVDTTTVFNVIEVTAGAAGVLLEAAIVIQPAANFTSGTVTLIDGAGSQAHLTTTEQGYLSVTDTALTDFTLTTGVTDVTIAAAAKSAATTASELSITNNEATAAHQLMAAAIAGDTTLMSTLNDSLTGVNSGSTTTTTDLAIQAAPQTDTISGSAVATRAMTGTVQGIVSNRMASLRSGDAFVTGMSAGNGMSANSGFIQAFGSEGEQKNTGPTTATVYGYDSQTSGVAIGFDGMTETGETIGLSASYSSTDVDGKGTGKSKNAIDSYTVSVYADKATENGYLEGSLTYGINDNTSSRLVNTAGLSRTYAGNYDSEQISLKVGGGMPNEVIDGTFVTPFASATGTMISTDAYTETSTTASDALRLNIVQDDITSLVGTVGVKAHMITDNGTPMISLSINNEFGDTTINSTNTYTGGGTAFKTSTDVEELSATLGLGYSFGNDATSLNINYEANANEDDYLSHYGTVKIIAKF
jgi:uncharacterized protein with beta-barrel porin domain